MSLCFQFWLNVRILAGGTQDGNTKLVSCSNLRWSQRIGARKAGVRGDARSGSLGELSGISMHGQLWGIVALFDVVHFVTSCYEKNSSVLTTAEIKEHPNPMWVAFTCYTSIIARRFILCRILLKKIFFSTYISHQFSSLFVLDTRQLASHLS